MYPATAWPLLILGPRLPALTGSCCLLSEDLSLPPALVPLTSTQSGSQVHPQALERLMSPTQHREWPREVQGQSAHRARGWTIPGYDLGAARGQGRA